MSNLIEDFIQNLYYRWFIDFNFPDENGNPYKDSDGSMVEQDGQKMPKGWKKVKLSKVLSIESGYAFKSNSYVDNGNYQVLTIKNFDNRNVDMSIANTVNEIPSNMPEHYLLKKNDILIALTGSSLGKMTQMNNDKKVLLNQRVGLAYPTSKKILNTFAFQFLKSKQNIIKELSGGSGQPNVSPKQIENIDIILPPLEVQEQFVSIVEPLMQYQQLKHELEDLQAQYASDLYYKWFCEESNINNLPEGWETKKLGDIVEIKTGKKDVNESSENGQYPFFTCSKDPIRSDENSFDCNAILLAGNGEFHLSRYNGKFEAYQRTYVITSEQIDMDFLFHQMKELISNLTNQSKGSIIKYLTLGMIQNQLIIVPPKAKQKEFVEAIS